MGRFGSVTLADVVGIFSNEAAITRQVGAILMERCDEWAVRRERYMTLETTAPLTDNPLTVLSAAPEYDWLS